MVTETSSTAWDNTLHHPDLAIKTSGTIAVGRFASSDGSQRGALAKIAHVIGTEASWLFETFKPGDFYVGVVLADQLTTTITGAVASTLLNLEDNDRVLFQMKTNNTLTVTQQNSGRVAKKTVTLSLASHVGQTIRAWMSGSGVTSMKISDDFTYTTTITSDGEVALVTDGGATGAPASGAGNGDVGGGAASNEIKNALETAFVTVEVSGNINLDGGITHKLTDFTAATATVVADDTMYILKISNAATTVVQLPDITDGTTCKKFIIMRNYSSQVGEELGSPALTVNALGADTIEGSASVGLPPNSSVTVTADGTNTWRIV
jgi:hypothetical protein